MLNKILPKLIGIYLNALALVAPSKVGKIGFNIFCRPIAPPVKPHHKEFLDNAGQFTFESEGVRLQGYKWGSGAKKILFLHGWQSHSFRWKKYVEAISHSEFTIYSFDAPAHGQSAGKYANIPIYSSAIKAFLEQIDTVDFVIGHSMGCFSLMHALYSHAHLTVGNFVAMASPGEANDFISFYKRFTGMNDRTFKYIIDHFRKELKHGPEYFSAPKFATALTMPGLLIHDEGDMEAPYHHAEKIHAAWPQSKLITTQGFGHNLRVPEVVGMVKGFVEDRNPILTH